MRRIVSCETPNAAAMVRSNSFFPVIRCTTAIHWEAGIPYIGCFGPGRRCLITGGWLRCFIRSLVGAVPFDTVSQTGRGRGRTLATENSTPRRFRHIAFSPDASRLCPSIADARLFGSPREPTRWMIRACHRKLSVLSYFSRQVDITRRNYVEDLLS